MDVLVRERRDDDLPALAGLLADQQAASRYPIRWPLPVPVEEFLARPTERRAWVAEVDGEVAGHVTAAYVDPPLAPVFAARLGPAPLGMLAVLFTSAARRRLGLGALLHDAAVAWIREQGEVPVLDVIPVHDAALGFYRRRGWVEVGWSRFEWLPMDLPDVLLMALPYPPSAEITGS